MKPPPKIKWYIPVKYMDT